MPPPFCTSLLKLPISVHGDEQMCDLGHLIALYTQAYCDSYADRNRAAADIHLPAFPLAVESVEWVYFDGGLAPELAELHVCDLLNARDASVVPRLRTRVICISINFVIQYDQWISPYLGEWLELEGASVA